MSEDQKITSVVKTKDPRRVESGKRLAAISKEAKARKARALEDPKEKEPSSSEPWDLSLAVGVVGAAAAVVGLYFSYRETSKSPKEAPTSESTPPLKDTPKKPNLDSFD